MTVVRLVGIAAVAAACLAVTLPNAVAQQTAPRARVVLQVSDADPGKWNLALNNARNLQADLGAANVDIEIVAYGPGIGMLKGDSTVGNRIDEAVGKGVKVLACENTMRSEKLTHQDMLPKVDFVPAGVIEIVKRQQQGWAYIRP